MADDNGKALDDVPKVDGEGEGCRGCFARQVEARDNAQANGEDPQPLCAVAARIQAMLDESREGLRPLRTIEPAPKNDGKMG